LVLVVAALFGASFEPSAIAQERLPAPFTVPFADRAPRVEGEVAVAVAVGLPDERVGAFYARRDSARTAGRARALGALHAWVDDALASARVGPREAQAAHAAVDREARVDGVRPLVDGAAAVVVSVPVRALRDACPRGGLPWSR
jgi:uncharacterized protein (DUF2236 family)